jgi:hypothetical protein
MTQRLRYAATLSIPVLFILALLFLVVLAPYVVAIAFLLGVNCGLFAAWWAHRMG